MKTCPNCHGEKLLLIVHSTKHDSIGTHLPCPTCGQSGEVTDEQLIRINRGAQLRKRRYSKNLGMREAAERMGVKPSELSYAEQGHSDPEPYFELIEKL